MKKIKKWQNVPQRGYREKETGKEGMEEEINEVEQRKSKSKCNPKNIIWWAA